MLRLGKVSNRDYIDFCISAILLIVITITASCPNNCSNKAQRPKLWGSGDAKLAFVLGHGEQLGYLHFW